MNQWHKYKVRSRAKQIEQIERESLMMLIKTKVSLDEKRELVKERNPFLFIFGEQLVVQGGQDYATYINKLYLGD